MQLDYDRDQFYQAHLSRDLRFDGKFFVAVKTTKIYCRPICPARKAKLENLEFFIHAVQAIEAGYRPCLRCRPETAPGCAAWIGTSAVVRRAVRLLDSEALNQLSIPELAAKLGIGVRWLRTLFQQQIGASPHTVLLAKKLEIARSLLDTSALSITDIVFSSGFQSVRRFNDAFKKHFQKSPGELRRSPGLTQQLKIQLSYYPPYNWQKFLKFLDNRALLQIELVDTNSYQSLFRLGDVKGWFRATQIRNNKIEIEFKLNKPINFIELITRLKNIFDLECDPVLIANALQEDRKLRPLINYYNGIRIPGCFDGFELAVRAIVGQKISVKAARGILSRIILQCGELQTLYPNLPFTHFFPTPQNILDADLTQVGLTAAKSAAIKSLALAVRDRKILLDGTADFVQTCQQLMAIKGIGPWTVQYIAMRGLRDPDAFPATDLELRKKIVALNLEPKKWMPWRAYAAVLLLNEE